MESSDLFSHPQKAQFVATDRATDEPVQNPEFSDRDSRTNKPTS